MTRLATDEATRMAESQVLDAIEENLPDEEEQSEWNWDALAKTANTRWNLNLRDRDLKKIGPSNRMIHSRCTVLARATAWCSVSTPTPWRSATIGPASWRCCSESVIAMA